MTTNATFIAAIQGMTVAGVTRHYDEPPLSLNTADLPAAFPELPTGSRVEPVSTCIPDAKVRTMGFVIALEPVGQSTNKTTYATIAGMLDNLETALDALDTGMVFTEYAITVLSSYLVAGTEYWALDATITGRNA